MDEIKLDEVKEETKEEQVVELTEEEKNLILQLDRQIGAIKVEIAGMEIQIDDIQVIKKEKLQTIRELGAKFHKLIKKTAEDNKLDLSKNWALDTINMRFVLKE